MQLIQEVKLWQDSHPLGHAYKKIKKKGFNILIIKNRIN